MKRFNSYTWLLKCRFATFSLKSQNTKPHPQLNKQLLPLFLSIFQIQPPNTSKMKHYCFDTTLLIKSENGEWSGKKFTSFISISQDCWIHKTALNHTDPGPNDPILSLPWFAYAKMAHLHSGNLRTITWQKSRAARTRLVFSRDECVVYTCAAVIILAKGLFLESRAGSV